MLIYSIMGVAKSVKKISPKGIKCLLSLFNIFYTPAESSYWLLCVAAPKSGPWFGEYPWSLSLSLYSNQAESCKDDL